MALVIVFVFAACSGDKPDKYCSNCGKGITNSVSFCQNCGAAVNDTDSDIETSSTNETSSIPESSSSSKPNSSSKPSTTTQSSSKPTVTSKPANSSAPSLSSKAPTPSTSSKPLAVTTSSEAPKPVHTHSYSKKPTEPTCTEKGYTTYTCSCGDTYVSDYVEPKHAYVDYVCSKCGEVDKSHAYEYLVEWIMQNGKTRGEYIGIHEYSDDFNYQYGISYSASGDYLYVSVLSEGDQDTNSDDDYVSIDLSGKNQKFEYYCAYGYQPTDYYTIGLINGKTHTSNSPISCDTYYGDSSKRTWFMEYTRLSVDIAIKFLRSYLEQNVPEITINDLGFENF